MHHSNEFLFARQFSMSMEMSLINNLRIADCIELKAQRN